VPRAVSPPPANADFSALLRLAVASVDYGGPRPERLPLSFLRALLASDVLGVDDQALAERLAEPKKRPQHERDRQRTSQPLGVFVCVNCDGDAVDAPWLYCSPLCNEMAKTIRYGRSVHADGRINDPDVKEALKIRVASVNGGGYPSQQRQLTVEQRQQIVERDEGRCQGCGGQGTEIDHVAGPIDGDINHPDNLQLLCAVCHRKKTIAGHRIATDPEHVARALEMHDRIHPPVPRQACDDVAVWAGRQRQLTAQRRAEFCKTLERLAGAALSAGPEDAGS
jgi:hypothetical protein